MGEFNVETLVGANIIQLEKYLLEIFNKSMTIQERVLLYSNSSVQGSGCYLKEWKSFKSLVNEKHFKQMLESRGVTEDQFVLGISKNLIANKRDKRISWLNLFEEMLINYIPSDNKNQNGIMIAIQPFVDHVEKRLNKKRCEKINFEIKKNVIDIFLENYSLELMNIVSKIIVIELENYKKEHSFKSTESEARFTEFLKNTFNETNTYAEFYSQYAVIARLIAVRTEFFLNNFDSLIDAISDCKLELCRLLECHELELSNVELSAGDSHEKGKSVVILYFNNNKIVYKPKNSDVSKSFEKFVSWINDSSDFLDIKLPKGIYKNLYSFQEFMTHESCENSEEVENFYIRMGHLIVLAYILNMNDLHAENIIAHKDYPVIIDGETLFHNEHNIDFGDKPYASIKIHISSETIMQSGLLPNSVEIPDDKGNFVDLSGISGGDSEIIVKGLRPVDFNKDTFRFEEQEMKRGKGQNVPMINNKYSEYKKFEYCIIQGFLEMSQFILENKKLLLSEKSPLNFFKDTKIRCLLKGTQKYASILGFSNHPNYTKEMFCREKLFENIWAYPHMDKRIVFSEYNDLLYGDIPIFYSKVDSVDIEDSKGILVSNFFKKSGLELSLDRIKRFDSNNVEYQLGILLVSLGIPQDSYLSKKDNRMKLKKTGAKVNGIYYTEKIASDLNSQAVWNERHDEVSWQTLDLMLPNKRVGFRYTTEALYDGLSGMGYYYLILYFATKKEEYFVMYQKIISSAIDFSKSCPLISAFEGCLSPIYPIIIEHKYMGYSKFDSYLIELIENLDISKLKELKSFDWINGLSGILVLMVEIDNLYNIKSLKKVIAELENEILFRLKQSNKEDIAIGFAHGYSGIAYALAKSGQIEGTNKNKNIVSELLKKETNLEKNVKDQRWCWGIVGMLKARLEIEKMINSEFILLQKKEFLDLFLSSLDEYFVQDDTLCHGNSGILDLMVRLKKHNLDEEQQKTIDNYLYRYSSSMIENNLVNGKFYIMSTQKNIHVGLFTGISGIALALLEISFDNPSDIQMLIS